MSNSNGDMALSCCRWIFFVSRPLFGQYSDLDELQHVLKDHYVFRILKIPVVNSIQWEKCFPVPSLAHTLGFARDLPQECSDIFLTGRMVTLFDISLLSIHQANTLGGDFTRAWRLLMKQTSVAARWRKQQAWEFKYSSYWSRERGIWLQYY